MKCEKNIFSLSWGDNYESGVVTGNLYFAEEIGAYDYDPVDDDKGAGTDEDEEFNNPYNVSCFTNYFIDFCYLEIIRQMNTGGRCLFA